jgi:hypothetical protein
MRQIWRKILSDISQEARYIVQCVNKTYSEVHKAYGVEGFIAAVRTSIKVMEHGD